MVTASGTFLFGVNLTAVRTSLVVIGARAAATFVWIGATSWIHPREKLKQH